MSASSISNELIRAYQATRYRVLDDPPFELTVDRKSADLAALYLRTGARSAAFLTAWNPESQPQSDEENAALQRQLLNELAQLPITPIAGFGEDPSGDWPGEPSFLALGLDRDAASALGGRFRQNAILWAGEDATPRLILLR